MQKRFFLCMLVLLAGTTGMAQQAATYPTMAKGDVFIKFSPLGIINPFDGNLSFGAEYCFLKKWSINMEAAKIFYSFYAPHTSHTSGVILRPSIRHYLNDSENFFLELQFHYKNVTYQLYDSLTYEATATTPAYGERTENRFDRKVIGVHAMGGIKLPMDKKRRFWLEFYWGLGMHFKWQHLAFPSNSIYKNENRNRIFRINDFNGEGAPAFPAGGRLVFRIL